MHTTPFPLASSGTCILNIAPAGELDGRWVAWVAYNALQGADEADLEAGLHAGGMDGASAAREVQRVLSSAILGAARRLVVRGAAMELAARLHRSVDTEPVVEHRVLDEATLYRDHWITHRPLVLRRAATAWPAASWTFAGLKERFRWAPMDVLVRRAGWWRSARETRRMAFGDLVDAALGEPSDVLYADGRTNVLDQAGLVPLRADLGLLPGLVGDGIPRAWIGPQGTLTPTHHDQSTAWQVLLVGRKRLYLASPLEPALAESAVGLYNETDPRARLTGEQAEVRWHQVDLGPGDAVFVPVGWWHQVEALEPSISVSMSGFRWPNRYAWYLPGRHLA